MSEEFKDQSDGDLMAAAALIQEELVRRQAIAVAEAEKSRYPIKAKFYVHGDKESNWSQAEELKLSKDACGTFAYTGLEITLDILVDKDGTAMATHINDVLITEPVEI